MFFLKKKYNKSKEGNWPELCVHQTFPFYSTIIVTIGKARLKTDIFLLIEIMLKIQEYERSLPRGSTIHKHQGNYISIPSSIKPLNYSLETYRTWTNTSK